VLKGILVQTKGPTGVVMTPDGRFVRVLLTRNHRTLGQEVTGTELKFPSFLQGVAVAAVLILVCILGLWTKMMPAAAAAYVALDINPSLELAVDNDGKVMEARGLDEEGEELLKKVTPEKLDVYQAVELLVAGAARYHYLNDTNNVVLATVTPARENAKVVDEEKLEAAVNHTVAALATPVKVVTERATVQEHKQASKKGVSVGRYLIHQGSAKQGNQISIDEVKKKGLGQLEKEKGIEIQHLLPHPKLKVKEVLKNRVEAGGDKENPRTPGKPVQILPKERDPGTGQSSGQSKHMPSGLIIKEQIQQRPQNNNPPQNRGVPEQNKPDDREGKEDKEDEEEKEEDENEQRRDDRRQNPLGQPEHAKQIKDSILDKVQEKPKNNKDNKGGHGSDPAGGHSPGKPGNGPKEKED